MKQVNRNEIIANATFSEDALPYFFSVGYEKFTSQCGDQYSLFYSDKLNALMPVRKYAVKAFSLLQVIYYPITLKGNRLTAVDEKIFLNEFIVLVKKEKLGIRIVQSYSHAVFNAVPDGSVSCPFGTYMIDITENAQELFSRVDPKGRNKIRNAQKNNVALKWGAEQLDSFYGLYKSTMERSGMYLDPIEHFKQMTECLGAEHVLCGVSYVDGKPQASIYIPYTHYSGYYLYGAMAAKMDNPGAMDYLQWEAICVLKRKGVKLYDFVGARLSNVAGTKLEGIQNFKKKFGGELMHGYLWKMNIDNVQCKLFDGLLSVNRAIKGSVKHKDIIDEELEKAEK